MMKKLLMTALLSTLISLSFVQTASAARQPNMERAMRALMDAERALNTAVPNKGGHRSKALKHIRRAITEVRQGIKFANQHRGGAYRDNMREERRLHDNGRRGSIENNERRGNVVESIRDRRQDRNEERLQREQQQYDDNGNVIPRARLR